MTGLPDPHLSRAVLVGAASYQKLTDLPAVRSNVAALGDALRADHLWGLPTESLAVVDSPESPAQMLDPVADAAEAAIDTLLLYYAGHGLLDARGELHLALTGSDPQRMYTAVPYTSLRDLLLDSRASRRIVILDCCYSGRALGQMGESLSEIADQADAQGTYLLAAAAENKVALAPEGKRYTAFTGELLDIIHNGIPGDGPLLQLDSIFRHLRAVMKSKGLPVPQKRDRNTAGELALVRNQAFGSVRHSAFALAPEGSGTYADNLGSGRLLGAKRRPSVPRASQTSFVIVDGDNLCWILRNRDTKLGGITDQQLLEDFGRLLSRLASLGQIRFYGSSKVFSELWWITNAAEQSGALVRILDESTVGGSHIDVVMAAEATRAIPRLNELVLVSGDYAFAPVLQHARAAGVHTTLVCLPQARSAALADVADREVDLADLLGESGDLAAASSRKDGARRVAGLAESAASAQRPAADRRAGRHRYTNCIVCGWPFSKAGGQTRSTCQHPSACATRVAAGWLPGIGNPASPHNRGGVTVEAARANQADALASGILPGYKQPVTHLAIGSQSARGAVAGSAAPKIGAQQSVSRRRSSSTSRRPDTNVFPVTTRKRDRIGDHNTMTGINYVVTAVDTPWETGAVRVIHVTGEDPRWRTGQLVNLVNQSTGLKLGKYEVMADHSGAATIWDLQ